METDIESFSERAEEVRDKFRSSIGGNMSRDTMLGKDVQQEKLGEFWRGNGIIGGDEYALFR